MNGNRVGQWLMSFMLVLPLGAWPDTPPAEALAQHPQVRGAWQVVDAWLAATQTYENIPGVSVGVVLDQTLLFEQGYGHANLRRKRPADADTIFSICSISKLFTSIGIMQLRDAGKLALRDPVADHLDWYDIDEAHAGAGPARIEGLLTHSAGLPRESDFPYWSEDDFPFPDRAALIARLSTQKTLYPADTRFQYSNLGMTLAGEIVAARSGQPYADYVQSRILEPLGLQDTRPFFPRALHGQQMAIGYSGMSRAGKRQPVAPFDTRAITPAAGFTSTVRDLAAFASWQFRLLGGTPQAGAGADVLDPNTLREMHRVHWVDQDWKTSWGLGFVVANADGVTVVGHTGGCPGYITSFMLVPKYKLATIALTNAADADAMAMTTTMMQTLGPALQAALETQGKVDADETDAADVSLADYAGNFSSGIWGGEVAVRVWGEQLAAVALPSDDLQDITKLKHVADDEFVRLTEDGEEREHWRFERDGQGRIMRIVRHSSVLTRID